LYFYFNLPFFDARKPCPSQLQDNCAMAVARLARGHAKHLERLRALNGLQILAHRGGR
jgi:hypothetical protein